MADPFVSYAQNGEDVVLERALKHVEHGRYIDVGANDPVVLSVTFAFYERGWSGITVDPVPHYAQLLRERRPRDIVVEAAVTAAHDDVVTLHLIPDTGLSTLVDDVSEKHRRTGWAVHEVSVPARRLDDILAESGWEGLDIHFMVVDTEGSEEGVLRSLDFTRWRPWILVVEATRPLTTEPTYEEWEPLLTSAGYQFCLFDGLSRYYVASERSEELGPALGTPANALDWFVLASTVELTRQREDLKRERDEALAEKSRHDDEQQVAILAWRAAALGAWLASVEPTDDSGALNDQLQEHLNHVRRVDHELVAMRSTLSWKVTRPLRSLRTLGRVLPRR